MSHPLPSRLKAVLFDLDGTLLDTAPDFVQVVHQLRREHDLSLLDEALISSQVSNGARALVTLALDLTEDHEAFESKRLRLLEIYSSLLGNDTRPYPGIIALLAQLDAHNIGWGISTNKPRAYTAPLLETLQLHPAPGSVVCPDDVGNPKPHPESLYLNCKHLGCQPHEVVYIGDHVRDIQAGRAAGMRTIAAAYGYIAEGDDPADWGADQVASSAAELAGKLAIAFN
jgi:2-phosphoglycolate phosphatase